MFCFGNNRPHGRDGVGAGAVLLALTMLPVVPPEARAADVTGTWIDHTGQGAVEIRPCGEHMCGRVVWLKDPAHRSRTGRPICGAQILGALRRQETNAWSSGWIYNPEDEERFNAEIKLQNDNTLLVTGYLGIKLLGETFTWKRAPADLQRCTAMAPAALK
jgi:uncharacterized protein (DUF2147 family)